MHLGQTSAKTAFSRLISPFQCKHKGRGFIRALCHAPEGSQLILLRHPHVEEIFISSVSFEGQEIEAVYQNLLGQLGSKCSGKLLTADEVKEKSDVLFTALPHGIAEQYADYCVKHGKKLIDLSADIIYLLNKKAIPNPIITK